LPFLVWDYVIRSAWWKSDRTRVRLVHLNRLPAAIVQENHFIDEASTAGAGRVEARDPLDVAPLVARHLIPLDGPIHARSQREDAVLGSPAQQVVIEGALGLVLSFSGNKDHLVIRPPSLPPSAAHRAD
jgi:hypothetical protein